MARVVRYSPWLLLCLALACVPRAHALDTGDIVIVSLKGEVQVTMKGAPRAVKAGSVLELPATVQTGRDGAIDLRQGETAVSVGPDTLLEFPALEKAGGPIDRIVQPRGNAFYSIGKRGARKLRVETPYLVGVVKGTQFNVAAQDTKTTISLFEGLLEIRAADDSSVVDIRAGEIATRSLVDTSIGVLKMDPGTVLPPPRAPQGSRNEGGKLPATTLPGATAVTRSGAAPISSAENRAGSEALVSSGEQVLVAPDSTITPNREDGGAVNVSIDARNVAVDLAPPVSVPSGSPGVEVPGTGSADIGAGSVDAGASAAATAPAVATESQVDVAVDLADADNVSGHPGAVDAATAAAVDVGNPDAAQIEVHAGANGGPLAGGEGAGDVVDVGGDHGAANIDLGASLGNTNVNADVDLGLGTDDDQSSKGQGNGNGNAYGNDNGNGNAHGYGNDDDGSPGNSGKGKGSDDIVDMIDDSLKGLLRKPGKR